jgi:hypothetical protein
MGEKTTVDLSTTTVRQLGKLLDAAADRIADRITSTAASAPPDAPRCPGLHGELWMRSDGPRGEVVAFLDDAGALRWVAAHQVDGVPAPWRPVLLAEPVKR